jgi:hypothetical protein
VPRRGKRRSPFHGEGPVDAGHCAKLLLQRSDAGLTGSRRIDAKSLQLKTLESESRTEALHMQGLVFFRFVF